MFGKERKERFSSLGYGNGPYGLPTAIHLNHFDVQAARIDSQMWDGIKYHTERTKSASAVDAGIIWF